jgi:hypothetical protein
MRLADKPCYPFPYHDSDGNEIVEIGISFRERLIVALASNPNVVRGGYRMDTKIDKLKPDTEDLFNYADAIIKEMEECYTL